MPPPLSAESRDASARVDRITYLASLVSDISQIDLYLDELRILTANQLDNAPLTDSEDATLTRLESTIRHYLLTKEPLRTFTPEILEQRLYEKVEAPVVIARLKRLVMVIVAIGVSLALGAMVFVPLETLGVRLSVALMFIITTFYVGGVGLLLASLKQFSPALRSIYRAFSVAFAVGCVGVVANIALLLIHQGNTPWQTFWFVNLPIYLSSLPLYVASIKMAKLQDIKTGIHPWLGFGSAITGMIVLAFTPNGFTLDPVNGIPPVFAWLTFAFETSSALLMIKIWRSSSELYKSPTKALIYIYASTSVGWFAMMFLPFVPAALSPDLSNIGRVIFIVSTFSVVWLGYAMNRLSRY